jgi:hypothetical protein
VTRARQETQRSLCEISLGRSEGSRRQTSAVKGTDSIAPRRGPRSRKVPPVSEVRVGEVDKHMRLRLLHRAVVQRQRGCARRKNWRVGNGREFSLKLFHRSACCNAHPTCNVQRATDEVQDATKSRDVTFGSRRRCPNHATHYRRMLAASRRVPQWSDL